MTERRGLASLFTDMHTDASRSGPKYAEVKRAILAAIESGVFPPGSKLPPEAHLTQELPVSLGTVQRALRDLADEGIVVRRQGHGTFVAHPANEMEQPWHCRFLGGEGRRFLPVYAKVIDRSDAPPEGAWTAHLRPSKRGVVRIDRKISVNLEFFVLSRFYILAEHGRRLMRATADELENANFKELLKRDLRLPVTHIRQTVHAGDLPAEACDVIGLADGTLGLVVKASASAGQSNPVYFQELFIPPTERELYLSDGEPMDT